MAASNKPEVNSAERSAEFSAEVSAEFSAEFKAKVALEAVRGVMTIDEIAQRHEVSPVMVRQWEKELLENAGSVFASKRGPKLADHCLEDVRQGEIGRLKNELDWHRKKSGL